MVLDATNVAAFLAFGNFLFAFVVSIYIANLREPNPALNAWRWAKLTEAAGGVLNLTRSMMPGVPFVLGNQFQIVGYGMELLAYLLLLNRPQSFRAVVAAMAIAVVAIGVASTVAESPNPRLTTLYASLGAIYFWMSITLIRARRNQLLARVMAGADLIVAVLSFTRVGQGLFITHLQAFDSNPVQIALYISALVLLFVNGFGFLLLAKQDDDTRLQEAVTRLEMRDAEQRQFIAMLSHEVRSPLAVIDATTQLLAARQCPESDLQPLIARIRRGAARLSHFFDNSLTDDRIDSGQLKLRKEECDVSALADWACEAGLVLSMQHRIRLEIESALPPLDADPILLHILLTNLLENAVKFAPGGTEIRLSFVRAGERCRIQVADQGPGIPEDELPVIFERYRRGRGAEHKPGAGLGLNVVKQIASLHGGHIEVSNLRGGGACFTVDLPFVDGECKNLQ
jgi:signal transduction histidine kinase